MIHAKALLIFIGLVALAIALAIDGRHARPAARLPLGLLVLSVRDTGGPRPGAADDPCHGRYAARGNLGWVLNGTAAIDALSERRALWSAAAAAW